MNRNKLHLVCVPTPKSIRVPTQRRVPTRVILAVLVLERPELAMHFVEDFSVFGLRAPKVFVERHKITFVAVRVRFGDSLQPNR